MYAAVGGRSLAATCRDMGIAVVTR